MQFSDFVGALRRRWLLLVVGFVLAILASVFAWQAIGPTYAAAGSSVLVPPSGLTETDQEPRNPLLMLGDLGQARDVMLSVMSSQAVAADFEQKFPGSSFTVSQDPASVTISPILIFVVTSAEPRTAVDGVTYLNEELQRQLKLVQSGLEVQGAATIEAAPLTQPTKATPEFEAQARGAILAGGGLALLVLLVVALIDGLELARRRRVLRREAIDSWLTAGGQGRTAGPDPVPGPAAASGGPDLMPRPAAATVGPDLMPGPAAATAPPLVDLAPSSVQPPLADQAPPVPVRPPVGPAVSSPAPAVTPASAPDQALTPSTGRQSSLPDPVEDLLGTYRLRSPE